MANKPISVVDPRWKRKKKAMKQTSKRRRLKSALKAVFNYLKSDSYMFAPFIHPPPPQIQPSPPLSYGGEVTIEATKKKKEEEKKLGEKVNDYLKCDAYMYAPLAMDPGTTIPPSESGRVVCNSVRRVVMEESERIRRRRSPLSSKGKVLTHA